MTRMRHAKADAPAVKGGASSLRAGSSAELPDRSGLHVYRVHLIAVGCQHSIRLQEYEHACKVV